MPRGIITKVNDCLWHDYPSSASGKPFSVFLFLAVLPYFWRIYVRGFFLIDSFQNLLLPSSDWWGFKSVISTPIAFCPSPPDPHGLNHHCSFPSHFYNLRQYPEAISWSINERQCLLASPFVRRGQLVTDLLTSKPCYLKFTS